MKPTARLALLLVLVLLAGVCLPATSLAERLVLRVGYMDYPGFIEEEGDGSYTGYAVEYLDRIAEYAGFSYEYVYGEWADLLEQLRLGRIDLLCSAQRTPERDEIYDFSAYPIGYTQGLLYARLDNERLCYEDYAMFNGITVGVLRGSAMQATFLRYAARRGFTCRMQPYDTETALLAALEAGDIDAMCSEHLANHTGLSLLAVFGADAYYLMSYAGCSFMESINYALQEVKTDVDFEADLFHKYYDTGVAATTLRFTSAESAFLAEAEPIRVGLDTARAPFCSYNEATNTFSGICVDVLEQIANRSGLRFEYVPRMTGLNATQLFDTGDYDVLCGVEHDYFVSNARFAPTHAFLESNIAAVGRQGLGLSLSGDLVVAVPSAYLALLVTLRAQYPTLHIELFPTNRECLEAVLAGQVDLFIQNTHTLSLLLQEPRYESLALLPLEITTEHTAMILPRAADPALLSVLNKCIAGLSDTFIDNSLVKHTFGAPYRYTLGDFLFRFRWQVLIIAALTALCFALVLRTALLHRRSELQLQKQNGLLADAVGEADRANRAKSQFLSRMSHEIRTPMNAIVGLTSIARHYEDDARRVDDCLGKIELSSRMLLSILNDVLDMSAIESNKLKVAHAPFDLREPIESIKAIYAPQCQGKGVAFHVRTELQSPALVGDSVRVSQILLNLISNAYKFTAAGGSVTLTAQELEPRDGRARVRFTVADTGCGMSREMLERLFQPFEQESAATARQYGGSGLGLSIAKSLAELMGGSVSVQSEQGRGTTFTVELPFDLPDEAEVPEAAPAPERFDFSGRRVLLAEDQTLNAEIAVELLALAHMQTDWVQDGREAVERYAHAEPPYDAILMDVQMPGMDGYEATQAIRDIERRTGAHVPILAMSASAFEEDVAAARAAGMDGHLAKPIDTQLLYRRLAQAMKM